MNVKLLFFLKPVSKLMLNIPSKNPKNVFPSANRTGELINPKNKQTKKNIYLFNGILNPFC